MVGVRRLVELGLAGGLEYLGGHLTDAANTPDPGLSGKQLDLLKEAVPPLSRVGVFWDATLQTLRETGWRIVPMGLWRGNAHEDVAFTPPHNTGRLVSHIVSYAASHDTRLGCERV